MRLTIEGICPCGGILRTAEWITKQEKKGRTTCKACGRTELRTEKINHASSRENRPESTTIG